METKGGSLGIAAARSHGRDCPSRTVVDVLANKWVLYILDVLRSADRPLRFGELRRAVDGVTQKSLTQRLRALERDGFVDRRVHATVPPRVEYRLTELGREVGPLLAAIADWSRENASRVVAARRAFEETAGGGGDSGAAPWTRRDGGAAPGADDRPVS
jgi:DNA-binding HxlR family transcriptional regulator